MKLLAAFISREPRVRNAVHAVEGWVRTLHTEMSEFCGQGRTRSAPSHDQKPSISSYLGGQFPWRVQVRTLKNLLELTHLRVLARRKPGGASGGPGGQFLVRLDRKAFLLNTFTTPTQQQSSSHLTLICSHYSRLRANAAAVLGVLALLKTWPAI